MYIAFRLAGDRGVEHLRDRVALRRATAGRPTPASNELRDLLVVDRAVGRVGVGQRAHVGGALDVVLAAQRQQRRARAADLAGHHRQVAEQLHDLGAVLVLGHAEAPQDRGVARPRRRCGRPRSRSAAGMPVISCDGLGRVGRRAAPRARRSPRCAAAMKSWSVSPSRRDDVARARARPRRSCPGRGDEVQHAVVGQLDPARVDRDELAAAQRRLLDARADDRVALRSGWRR